MAAAEGSVDDLLPEIALAAALVALDEVEHDDDDDDMLSDAEPDEEPKTCTWEQLLVDEELKDETSITAKQFREDFRLPQSFFLRLVEVVIRSGLLLHSTTHVGGNATEWSTKGAWDVDHLRIVAFVRLYSSTCRLSMCIDLCTREKTKKCTKHTKQESMLLCCGRLCHDSGRCPLQETWYGC